MVIKSGISGPGIKGVALYDSHTDTPIRMAVVEGVTRLPTSDLRSGSFYQNVTEGNLSEYSVIHKFGKNDAVTNQYEPIAIGGVYQMPQVANATTLRVKAGGNANDTVAGSGARQIKIEGCDETGAEVSEYLNTAGVNVSSDTTITFLRIHRAYISKSGTYPAAIGTHSQAAAIVIENSAGTADWVTISVNMGQSHIGAYCVDLGKEAIINNIFVTNDGNNAYELMMFVRENFLETAPPYSGFLNKLHLVGLTAPWNAGGFHAPAGPFPPLTDIVFVAQGPAGGAVISVDFEIILKDV